MAKIRHDSRDAAIRELLDVIAEAVEVSLIAQLYARGNDSESARRLARQRDTPEYRKLTSPDGASGYLAFQWISQSLLKTAKSISEVDLQAFWVLVDVGQDTSKVYATPLRTALKPLDEGLSGVRQNLAQLFAQYPSNKIGIDSLTILKRLDEFIDTVETSIKKLLLLSPPAPAPIKSKLISWKTVLLVFVIALLTLPVFYWYKASDTGAGTQTFQARAASDAVAIKEAAKETPASLAKVVFTDVIPGASNALLLLSALLGIVRAFSSDARKDTKKMIEELSGAAKKLQEIKGP
jgi:hypothetical protein